MHQRSRRTAISLTLVILALFVQACAVGRGPVRPATTLVSPANGAIFAVGQEILVESLAVDDAGIERVELWVNDVLARTDNEPTSGNERSFGTIQSWTPTQVGRYTLSIKAYNRRGVVSLPSSVLIEVELASAALPRFATPTPTMEVPGVETPAPQATATACMNNATFVADITIPDETRLRPSQEFEKIWRIRNSGDCDWGLGYSWVFEAGDQLGAPASISMPAVAVNADVDIAIGMKAPAEEGRYSGRWRMQAPDGQSFGQRATIVVIVLPDGLKAPAAPANLQAQTAEPNGVTLSWKDQSDDEVGVRIYSDDGITLLATLDISNAESVTLENLSCDTELGFVVKAYNAAGESAATRAVRIRTPACQPNLPVIHFLKAEPGKIRIGQKALLSWELEGAREARLFPGGEEGITSPASLEVEPTETTTYRLVATNEHGSVEMKVTVFVE